MATEDEGGGMEDVELSLETGPEDEGGGLLGSISGALSSAKDKYVDFHSVDEESESWGDQQVAGGLSRRGFLAGTAEVAAGGYVISEATDNDGFAVDLSAGNGNGDQLPGAGDQNNDQVGNQTSEGSDIYEGNELGVRGDVSDELYLQEDGTVIAVDHGHREWRAFDAENFPENSGYESLHDELEGNRESTDIAPPSVSNGIEVSQQELFNHDTSAYNDMSDEAEWDLIFDSNPNYDGGA